MMKMVNARAATDALLAMENEAVREVREDPERARDKALMAAGAAAALVEIGAIEPEMAELATGRFAKRFKDAWVAGIVSKGGAA